MTEQIKRFTLRIDAGLFEKIQKSAVRNKRAAGKEMEFILEKHFLEAEND